MKTKTKTKKVEKQTKAEMKEEIKKSLEGEETHEVALRFAKLLVIRGKADEELAFFLHGAWMKDPEMMRGDIKTLNEVSQLVASMKGVTE
mgnify:CR=1 FL=1